MKVRLSDISLFDLDGETSQLVAQFVRLACAQEGAALKLSDPYVVRSVFSYGLTTNNLQLRALFHSLRRLLRAHFGDSSKNAMRVLRDANQHSVSRSDAQVMH